MNIAAGQLVRGRTLILLRHAKSDWSGGEADLDRPLAKRGRRQAPAAGRWLASSVGVVDLAVVSPANRARSTWDLVAAELEAPPPVRVEDRVYAASGNELLDVVRELPDDVNAVVLVGHSPELGDLVLLLTGQSVSMPTSALAVIDVSGTWSSLGRDGAVLRAAGRLFADDQVEGPEGEASAGSPLRLGRRSPRSR
jgi:phosphohistidine phosphatase